MSDHRAHLIDLAELEMDDLAQQFPELATDEIREKVRGGQIVLLGTPRDDGGSHWAALFDKATQADPEALAAAQDQARREYERKIAWAPKGHIITLTANEWVGLNVAARDK